jgi:hypothetical protein
MTGGGPQRGTEVLSWKGQEIGEDRSISPPVAVNEVSWRHLPRYLIYLSKKENGSKDMERDTSLSKKREEEE